MSSERPDTTPAGADGAQVSGPAGEAPAPDATGGAPEQVVTETVIETVTVNARSRVLLFIAIGLLAGTLVALIIVFARLIAPLGAPQTVGPAAQGDAVTWVRSMYGFGPSLDEQLYMPTSVAIGPDGEVWATDPARARVMGFDADGTFRTLLHTGAGGTGKGQFLRPESIDADDLGRLYIADSRANKIIVFSQDGRYEREWPIEGQARGVFVRGAEVYVLGKGKVFVFDTDGKLLRSFGTQGAAAGQIDAYQGIAADADRIYVADALNSRVQAFDQSGTVLWIQPAKPPRERGPGAGRREGAQNTNPFDVPQDLVLDGAGRLVVVDAFDFGMTVLDPETGAIIDAYSQQGRRDGFFYYPSSIDYDPVTDWFAVADTGNNRVQVVRIPGSGGGVPTAARELALSPWRYWLLPLLLALIVVWVTIRGVARLRRLRRTVPEETAEEDDAD